MFVLPTYKRPEKLRQFFEIARDLKMSAPGMVVVNGEDQRAAYDPVFRDLLPSNWEVAVMQQNVGMVGAINWFFQHRPNLDWYGVMGDDMVPKTEYFDMKCLSLLEPFSMISCMDETADGVWRIAGVNILSGPLVRACGFVYPPCTWHICGDDWLQTMGPALGIWRTATDVVISNSGTLATGVPQDETQQSSFRDFGGQLQQYHRWLAEHGGYVMERVRLLMQTQNLLPAEGVSRWRMSNYTPPALKAD